MKRDLSWLGSLSLSTGKYPSLTAMEFLMEKLGHPEEKVTFVHIAGTNGKGSVAEMMAKILEEAGYRTGKFLSPHLVRFNERIQINGREIADEEIEDLLDNLQPVIDEYEEKFGVEITLFEIETTMALVYYAREECDFVVLEVGLGGKFDCTNIVTAAVSVIVSIGYDHMNVLGESLAEIAAQKAGIIKTGGKVVSGKLPEEAEKVVRERCLEMGAEWREVEPEQVEITETGIKLISGEFCGVEVPLRGLKQAENVAIALETVSFLCEAGWRISDQAIKDGLSEVVHHGRFEVVSETPVVVFDGAHNLPAIENFWQNAEAYYPGKHKKMIVSLLKKKDVRKILQALLREDTEYIFTTGNDPELYQPAEELLRVAQELRPKGKYSTGDLRVVLEAEKKRAAGMEGMPAEGSADTEMQPEIAPKIILGEVIFVVGSFYVYKDVREALDE